MTTSRTTLLQNSNTNQTWTFEIGSQQSTKWWFFSFQQESPISSMCKKAVWKLNTTRNGNHMIITSIITSFFFLFFFKFWKRASSIWYAWPMLHENSALKTQWVRLQRFQLHWALWFQVSSFPHCHSHEEAYTLRRSPGRKSIENSQTVSSLAGFHVWTAQRVASGPPLLGARPSLELTVG